MTKEPVGGEMEAVYASMGISRDVYRYGERTLERLKGRFDAIDRMAEYNQLKVVKAMQDCPAPQGTAITIWDGIHWSPSTRSCFIPRLP